MEVVSWEEFWNRREEFKKRVLAGAVFVYPTDTIYGIGCDATNDTAVKRVRSLKQRDEKPFSVIAPSKKWIEENCAGARNLSKLPGAYTLILRMTRTCVSKEVSKDSLGVRIPNHQISEFVALLGRPIVTTSVNRSGQPHMTSLEDRDGSVVDEVDFVVYEGPKTGNPSTVVDLTEKEPKVKER